MSADSLTYHSRLSPDRRPQPLRTTAAAATRSQSALEYALFIVFGATIIIAAAALIITNSASFRSVPNRVAEGIKADRVNLLLMDTFDNNADGAVTTDALMLMSVKPSTHEVVVTSIPRDLWVKLGKFGQRRIGAAPAVGNSAGYPGAGAGLTADTIQEVLGQPVHAYVTLDRNDLIAAIDSVGGIDVLIEQPFYEFRAHDRFVRGVQHFDGARAARYAFSSYVLGPAKERFAREGRQQQVITALSTRASGSAAAARMTSIPADDRTNLTPQQMWWLATTINAQQTRRVSLAPYLDAFDVATVADAGEAVRPIAGDYAQIRNIVANVFTPTATAAQ